MVNVPVDWALFLNPPDQVLGSSIAPPPPPPQFENPTTPGGLGFGLATRARPCLRTGAVRT